MAESDDDKEFLAFLKAYFKTEDVVLSRLPVGCTMKVYRLTVDGGPTWFCKRSRIPRRMADFLRALPNASVLVALEIKEPLEFKGEAVLIYPWCTVRSVALIDMDETQFEKFLVAAKELFAILGPMSGARPPEDEEEYWQLVRNYVNRHHFLGKVFGSLVDKGRMAYAYSSDAKLCVTHGDFHSANFGFTPEGQFKFLDFDLIVSALPTEDLTHLVCNAMRRSELIFNYRRRKLLFDRYARMIRFFGYPREDWSLALNRERLRTAGVMINRRGDTWKPAVEFLRRDWTVRKMYEVIERV